MTGSLLARPASRVAFTALSALVLMSCGGKQPKQDPQAATDATHPVASADVRRLLEGNAIGSVKFGQTRSTVIAELERLLGPPHETIPGICGFGRSTDWIGLNIRSHDVPSSELNLSFKHSRLVGYAVLHERRGASAAAERGSPGHHQRANSR